MKIWKIIATSCKTLCVRKTIRDTLSGSINFTIEKTSQPSAFTAGKFECKVNNNPEKQRLYRVPLSEGREDKNSQKIASHAFFFFLSYAYAKIIMNWCSVHGNRNHFQQDAHFNVVLNSNRKWILNIDAKLKLKR